MATANPNTYIQNDSGTYIPATQRPDGSWRKARRVKDGYIPQDEMPLYESKGKQWAKNKPTHPVGLDLSYAIPQTTSNAKSKKIPGLTNTKPEEPVLKTKKKKKKKEEGTKAENLANQIEKLDISASAAKSKTETQPAATDPAKRLRNLRKKLRDIIALKQKIDSGELATPDKDQLEKIARRALIEAEIEDLELDLEDD